MNWEEGWSIFEPSSGLYPDKDALIEIMRPEWNRSNVMYWRDANPMMNIYGLYWRLTGIAKEELGG
jgi:hypothetical protein